MDIIHIFNMLHKNEWTTAIYSSLMWSMRSILNRSFMGDGGGGCGGGGGTCLMLKSAWVIGSGQGPQWGTWPLTRGRRTSRTKAMDPVIVEGAGVI